MLKKLVLSALCGIAFLGIAEGRHHHHHHHHHKEGPKYLCANCYWGTECGEATMAGTKYHRYNPHHRNETKHAGMLSFPPPYYPYDPYDAGNYYGSACDNGRDSLGVLWADKPCSKTGGITILVPEDFPGITQRPECQFGR